MNTKDDNEIPTGRWLLGMAISTTFCVVYYFAPLYMLSAVVGLWWCHFSAASWVFAAPLVLSVLTKPMPAPWLVGQLTPMADYFQYSEAFEFTDDDLRQALKKDKKLILAFQPHGVLSLCGMSAAVRAPPDLRRIKSAAASALLRTPILKNVMGIFGLVDASKASLQKLFRDNTGIDACVVLYVGGIAELFKSSRKEERLFLSQRKGFIKLAMREGVDVVPAYLFGNTSVLTVIKHGPLAALSRKLQVSLTYFWGKYYLPIPRDDKVLYARGKPLGIPHIKEPTDEDVNLWHDKYCKEVARLFDKYKE